MSVTLVYLCFGLLVAVPVLGLIVALAVMFIPILRTRATTARLSLSGVSAPALVNSVRVGSAMSSGQGRSRSNLRWRVYFDVVVQPADAPPFQAEFMALLDEGTKENITAEKRIWVRYDPKNHSQVAFEESESAGNIQKSNQTYVNTISSYWEMDAKLYQPLRINGQRVSAVILEREKVLDASSTPGGPAVYRFWLEITPPSGLAYKAETQMMVQDEGKFAVGKSIFIRFDPARPEVVAVDPLQ